MNYRHAYHAGNFADVMKHAVLALIIEYMKIKPQPFRVIDVHAGLARYDLAGIEAGKTCEWQSGIARLLTAQIPDDAAALLAPYLNAVRAMNDDQGVHTYPGSPLLARMLMRSCDTLIANELHPEDCQILRSVLKGSPNTKVQEGDAFATLKSLLPPPEKRGLVLIDPPFEAPGEFARVAGGAGEAVKRFATGTYVIWYPFKEPEAVTLFLRQIRGLGLRKVLNARLATAAPGRLPGLTDSGLLIINPPYVLAGQLAILGPVLAKVLRAAPGARFTLDDWSY